MKIFWQTLGWGMAVIFSLFCFFMSPVLVCDILGASFGWGYLVLGVDIVVTVAVWRAVLTCKGVLPL